MLYGFPGAGKTFFARQLSEGLGAAHIQGDRIRSELFSKPTYDKRETELVASLMDYMAEEFLKAKVSVIYDMNAARFAKRRALRDIARRLHVSPLLVWMQIDIESSFTRIAKRDKRHIDDKYASSLDRTTFEAIINQMQNPNRDEDYLVISGKHTFSTQQNAIIKKMHNMGLISSDEAVSRVVKPELVNLVPNAAGGRVDMNRRKNIMIR
jgi:predicted kinase